MTINETKNIPLWLRITYSIVLSLIFMTFGVLQFMTTFEATAEWPLFANTSLLGWTGEFMTGIALVIIGLIILWSAILYFRGKNPEGNSFLLIGSGVGVVFGLLYVLVVVADIIAVLVDAAAEAVAPDFTEFSSLYFPILLGIISLPIFLLLFIKFRDVRKEKAQAASS